MHFWNFPTAVPILLGYYRLTENLSLSFDFLMFEIMMCTVLYLVMKGLLLLKVKVLEQANEEANIFMKHMSNEPNSSIQNECIRRCLQVSDAALNEYDSLLLYFGNLQHEPSRRVCTQCLPLNYKSLKINSEESFQCLKSEASRLTDNISRRTVSD